MDASLLQKRGEMLRHAGVVDERDRKMDGPVRQHAGNMLVLLAEKVAAAEAGIKQASIVAACWPGSGAARDMLYSSMVRLSDEVQGLQYQTEEVQSSDASEGPNGRHYHVLTVFWDNGKATRERSGGIDPKSMTPDYTIVVDLA